MSALIWNRGLEYIVLQGLLGTKTIRPSGFQRKEGVGAGPAPRETPGLWVCQNHLLSCLCSWTVKEQCVNLLAKKLWEELLDDEQPDITIMDWCALPSPPLCLTMAIQSSPEPAPLISTP